MSTQTEITRLQGARDTLRAKAVELGIGLNTDKLDTLATKYNENLSNKGAVSAKVKEGESYTIPKGYHNGGGVVEGVAGGGNYTLQAKTATPTKTQQAVTSDEGYYGLSGVTVAPIPDNYQDISGTTVTQDDVLTGKTFVKSDGVMTAGTMPNNDGWGVNLNSTNEWFTLIPKGYHSGTDGVSCVVGEKIVTPTTSVQNITPGIEFDALSKVTVEAIPSKYKDTTGSDALAENLLVGKKAVTTAGTITGTMPNVGAVTKTLDTGTISQSIAKGFHSGTGAVSIVLEEKTATPTTTAQSVTPSTGKVLSKVTVNAIPSQFKDTTGTDALAANILAGKKAATTAGIVTGAMVNNGAIAYSLDAMDTVATIPAGYHNGEGVVFVHTEEKTTTPSKYTQEIKPTTGKVLSSVIVEPIPEEYVDISDATDVTPNQLLVGLKAYNNTGTLIVGTMPDRGDLNGSINGLTTTQWIIPNGYHWGAGRVTLTKDIENALAEI